MCLPPKPASPSHLFTTCFTLSNNIETIKNLRKQIKDLNSQIKYLKKIIATHKENVIY